MASEQQAPAIVPGYFQPLIANQVDTGDTNSMLSTWTQDAVTTEHTAVIVNGAATGSHDPSQMAFRLMALFDTSNRVIPAGELGSFNAYINITQGLADDDKTLIYVGLVNAATMAGGDRIWMRMSATDTGDPRKLLSGRNATIGGNPAAFACVNARQELLTELSTTNGSLRVIETICFGSDVGNTRIASSASGLASLATDLTAAPHVLIAVGGQTTTEELTLKFFIDIEAHRLPAGVFPR